MRRSIIFITILAVACALGGFVVGRAMPLRPYKFAQRFALRYGKDKPGIKDKILKRLTKGLDLTPAQRESIQLILEESRQELDLAKDEFKLKIKTARSSAKEKILQVLDPEQQKKFLEMKMRLKAKKRNF